MKPFMPLLAGSFAALLAGCADTNWFQSGGKEVQYTPMQGGPGYGPTSPLSQYNAAPEGTAPVDMPFNSDALGGFGGGGYGASGYSGATGSGESGGAGGMSSEPGIGSGSPATRDSGGGSSGSSGTGSAGGSASGGSTSGGSTLGGAAGGAAGGMSSEPGIGSSSPATRDSSGGSGTAGATGAPLDQQSSCELQRRVMAARTPEERQALMEQAMPGMSQDARERHLQMMRESCQ